MEITKHSIIYSGEHNPALSSCSFPSICKLKNGTIIASFKGAEKKGPYNYYDHAMTCFSYDGGKTFTEPVEIFAPPIVDGKPTTLRTIYFIEAEENHVIAVANAVDATMKDLPYYNEETEGLKETYILVAHSKDGAKTFGAPERIQVNTFYNLPIPLTGAPFKTADGRIGIQFEVNKHYYETEYWVHHSAIVYSADNGYTWGDEVVVTDSPTIYYWDQRTSALSCGTICDVFWTFDREKGDYINIHMCKSTDGGRTFSDLYDIGLVGQPGNVVDTKDGKLLLVYINRDSVPVIRLAESCDGGKTWNDKLTVFDYGENTKGKQNAGMNDVWSEMAAFSIGHPFMELMDDTTLWVFFYSGPQTDRTDFHVVEINL